MTSPTTSRSAGSSRTSPATRTLTVASPCASSRSNERSVWTRCTAPTTAFAPTTAVTNAASVTEPTAADRAAPSASTGVSGFDSSSDSGSNEPRRCTHDPRTALSPAASLLNQPKTIAGALEETECLVGVELMPTVTWPRTRHRAAPHLQARQASHHDRNQRRGIDRDERALRRATPRTHERPDTPRRRAREREERAPPTHLTCRADRVDDPPHVGQTFADHQMRTPRPRSAGSLDAEADVRSLKRAAS